MPLLQAAEGDHLAVVVGTKHDLVASRGRHVSHGDGLLLARELNSRRLTDVPYFETSSLNGQRVGDVFEYIFQRCLGDKESHVEQSVVTLETRTRSRFRCC